MANSKDAIKLRERIVAKLKNHEDLFEGRKYGSGALHFFYSQKEAVYSNNARTKELGLRSDLTVEEWLETLLHFECKCAYCQKKPYQAMDHVLPVRHGGGTFKANVVPACNQCNIQRKYTVIPGTERVEKYLVGMVKCMT